MIKNVHLEVLSDRSQLHKHPTSTDGPHEAPRTDQPSVGVLARAVDFWWQIWLDLFLWSSQTFLILKMNYRRMLDGEEKSDEDSLLFDFFLTQKTRTVLGLSPKRRMVSSFVHAKEKRNPSNPYIPKKCFWPSFSLISYGEELSSFGIQNYGLFLLVVQIR